MERREVEAWLRGYGRAWEERDPDAAAQLFSDAGVYHWGPFGERLRGPAEVRAAWERATGRQRDIHFDSELLMQDGVRALALWRVSLERLERPVRIELEGVFLLTFAEDGRCDELREWWGGRETPLAGVAALDLNHVTLPAPDVEGSAGFYRALGLVQIVAAYPDYARFASPIGPATLSLAREGGAASVHFECDDLDATAAALRERGFDFEQDPTDQPYLWREAVLRDPGGNAVFLYRARENRLNPPWRLPRAAPPA